MNYYGVTRSTDHLAHYGVKGMRWGVRKAIITGDQRSLDRHYRKAAKKLAKLQKYGLESKKYAAKATALGAGAALATAAGIQGLNPTLKKKVGNAIQFVPTWSGKTAKAINEVGKKGLNLYGKSRGYTNEYLAKARQRMDDAVPKLSKGLGLAAIGTGIGLAGAAGYHGYRAANGRKYRQQALDWKKEMDNAFKGTQYEGEYTLLQRKKKRRR